MFANVGGLGTWSMYETCVWRRRGFVIRLCFWGNSSFFSLLFFYSFRMGDDGWGDALTLLTLPFGSMLHYPCSTSFAGSPSLSNASSSSDGSGTDILDRIKADLKTAMRSKDSFSSGVLRVSV